MLDIALSLMFYLSYLAFPILILLVYLAYKKRRSFYWVLAFFILLFIYTRFVEPNIIRIDREKIDLGGGGNGLKVIVAADLHMGVFSSRRDLKRIVDKINKLDGDLVVIPGDLVFRLPVEKFSVFSELKNIRLPLALVLGNHDCGQPVGVDVSSELTTSLADSGIVVLDNKVKDFEFRGKQVRLVGLSDYYNDDANFMLLRKNNPEQFLLSLTHNPDLAYQYPTNSQADITISGHTHGGQIRLPWVYKLVIPSDYFFDAGLYQVGNYPVFVSSGLGVVGLPMRFFRFPEINVLELN
ncbi:MAG: metallophosphoesterase [Patescibacteria group bacterium]